MMGSKLPMPILGKIWDLSDVDRDGCLDRYEFTVAMHLVSKKSLKAVFIYKKKLNIQSSCQIPNFRANLLVPNVSHLRIHCLTAGNCGK